MPVILPPIAYDRWLSSVELDPREPLVPYDAALMKVWPISMSVRYAPSVG